MDNQLHPYLIAIIAIPAVILSILTLKYRHETKLHFSKLLRYLFYSNSLVNLARKEFLTVVIPIITTTYFVALDIWGEKWNLFTAHPDAHEYIFFALAGLTIISLICKGIADRIESNAHFNHQNITERFTLLTSRLVKQKLDRFKEAAQNIDYQQDIFHQITLPNLQINLALTEIVDLMHTKFGVRENELCITIMKEDPTTKSWRFTYQTNKSWKHTSPQNLIRQNSTAKQCLDSGEPIFHADKQYAAKKSQYLLSKRDTTKGKVGSVFCYPAYTRSKDHQSRFVISIVTYGKMLCAPSDTEQCDAIELIFSDICRRIDLELTLESIKDIKSKSDSRAQGASI